MRLRHAWLLVITLNWGSVSATTFIQRPFPETVKSAPSIVRGKPGESRADWGTGPDSTKRIYTYTDIDITEVIKGDITGSSVRIREMGGQKDGVGLEVAGTARFTPGEDVVIFLGNPNSDGSRDVRGMMMGKFEVKQDPQGQEYIEGHGDTRSESKWTLSALRKMAQEPNDSPPQIPAKQRQSGHNPDQAPPPQDTASRLQPDTLSEGASAPSGWDWRLGVAAIFAVFLGGFLLMRRRSR